MNISEQRRHFLQSGKHEDLPIVDAHLHFWDPRSNYHPWLCDEPMIPFRYGDYSRIRVPFFPQDYQQQCGQHSVLGCVYMEAEWQPGDAAGEARWIHGLYDRTGWPNAMIAQAWLDAKNIDAQLDTLAGWPLVRGVRHKPATMPRAEYRANHGLPGSLTCPHFERGFALLARHGFIFELQAPWWHLHELIPLLERHPDIPVVINHAGVPGDRQHETLAGWKSALEQVATYDQVMLKLSGLGINSAPWRSGDNRWLIRTALELFGPDRCMFASNFPVDGLVTDLDSLWSAFKQLSSHLSTRERLAVFCDNTVRCYGLGQFNISHRTNL